MNSLQDQYPKLAIDLDKLRENLAALTGRCQDLFIQASPVVKAAGALPKVCRVLAEGGAEYLCTSRMDHLRLHGLPLLCVGRAGGVFLGSTVTASAVLRAGDTPAPTRMRQSPPYTIVAGIAG